MQKQELLQPISEKGKSLKKGNIYQHYKGFLYKLLSVGRHSESLEEVVVYQALYGDRDIWVRPLEMFLEHVDLEDQKVPRFKRLAKNTKPLTSIALYLAGNIQKGHEQESQIFWTNEDREILQKGLAPNQVVFLNPALRADDLSDQKGAFGRDMTQVFCANVVFVDARERRGLGVGAEMMWAKMHHLPVLTLAPKNSHYHQEELSVLGVTIKPWIHPFVESLSDAVVEDLQQGIAWLKGFLLGKRPIKGPEFIHETMKHYQTTQFPSDHPMREIFEEYPALQEKMAQS